MSVKLIDNQAFYGFRVRRTVNGKLHQEYFSLKQGGKRLAGKNRKPIEDQAQLRDEALRTEQKKSKEKRKAELCFNKDGSVKGISYLVKTEKSGTKTPIYQIGIASTLANKIVCTSFSINAHGNQEAWNKAVQTYAEHKQIRKGSKLYRDLLAALPKAKPAVKIMPQKSA